MRALEVSRNGKRLCVAAIGDNGVVDAHVAWNMRSNRVAHPRLNVGGLNSTKNQFLDWIDQKKLRVGDVITIRAVEVEKPDRPKSTRPGFGTAKVRNKRKK